MSSLEGIHELQAKLRKCQDLGPVRTVVRKNGSRLQKRAMEKAPVDTGTLKRGITLDILDAGKTAKVESTVHYGGYVEYGTRFMTAQPYVEPSFNEVKGKFKSDLEKLVK